MMVVLVSIEKSCTARRQRHKISCREPTLPTGGEGEVLSSTAYKNSFLFLGIYPTVVRMMRTRDRSKMLEEFQDLFDF